MRIWVITCLLFTSSLYAQVSKFPSVGAQVFIEPGQTQAQIEGWFKIMHSHGLSSCRIRMFEAYMQDADGREDFRLFDWAFDAAAKYDVRVFATIFPEAPFENIGGIKLPENDQELDRIASYVERLVYHFKDHEALEAWVLINEPGLGGLPNTPFVRDHFQQWKDTVSTKSNDLNEYRKVDFAQQAFLLDLNTWFLGLVANKIREQDSTTALHVNNHQLFSLVDEYDFPAWMQFLSSLGASIHPSWHFRYFDPADYPLAVSAHGDLIGTSAGQRPFWVTELQAGGNTFSGYQPIAPTEQQIAQWLWLTIFGGAEGTIFWSLNPRSVGVESGEWALLDYTNQPSDRLRISADIAQKVRGDTFFTKAEAVRHDIQIIYTHESIWAEKYLHVAHSEIEARNWGACMKSTLGFYKALSKVGVAPAYGEIGTIDWEDPPATLIIPNQLAISEADWKKLQRYVTDGGKMIITGLSGQFDETMYNRWLNGNRYVEFLGGTLLDHRIQGDRFSLSVDEMELPAHYLKGQLKSGATYQVKNHAKGSVIWVPSMIGLGAWLHDEKPLARWLLQFIPQDRLRATPLPDGVILRWMESDQYQVGLFINNGENQATIKMERDLRDASVVFGQKSSRDARLELSPKQTLVLKWKKD